MLRTLLLVSALALSACATPTPTASGERNRRAFSFQCDSGEHIRIIFDENDRTATVVRIRRPSVTLQLANESNGVFRYNGSEGRYIEGSRSEVVWAYGGGRSTACPSRVITRR
ncbi:hypothetical protein [Terricaulis sp.]|uniref:hypothetical protein n=1 Tax=Terricaulis sp. TaxID=2768686 RepID=UPI0037850883